MSINLFPGVLLAIPGDPENIADPSGDLLFASDERLDTFGEQSCVERFAERLVKHGSVETAGSILITQQCDQNGFRILGVLPQILSDHEGFLTAHSEIHHNTVRVQRLGLNLPKNLPIKGEFLQRM